MTLQAMESMRLASQERSELCQRIRQNPNCANRESLLRNSIGINVAMCTSRTQSLGCAQFFSEFPEYAANRMQCEPYEVCKLGNDATTAEGCRRFGVQLKDGFIDALSPSPSTLAWSALFFLSPSTYFATRGNTVAKEAVESFKNDTKQIENMACLDPETQAQLQCYLLAKYGSVVTGAAGAARFAAGSFMARMATLERSLLTSSRASGRSIMSRMIPKNPAAQIGPAFRNSGKFRFFRAGKGEVELGPDTLKAGRSYTVVIRNRKIVIGENYRGSDTGTTSRSHVPLDKDAGGDGNTYFGGAIRINQDGSIDVSGYHRLRTSQRAADDITAAIRDALPEARIRSTANRLSTLDN